MKLLRKILVPLNPVYFLFVWLRNKAYDWGLFESKSYDLPTICVGNLSVGGTGKTPMVEYLIRLLESTKTVAVLSRGYGRKSQGFVLADSKSNNNTLGDEPFQIKSKFPGVIVAVDNDRQHGITCLQALDHPPKIILLDDAFQHRRVQAGFSVLLTSYDDLYCDDIVLPAGNLREPRSGAERAQIVVVTKCPHNLSNAEKKVIQTRLKLNSNQQLFFSSIVYDDFIYSDQEKESIQTAIDNDLIVNISSIDDLDSIISFLEKNGLSPRFHMKIETGMNRLGFDLSDISLAIGKLLNYKNLNCEGIYTHYATSDEGDLSYAYLQQERFEKALKIANEMGYIFKYKHI